jgi:hypothetical protein
MMNKVATAALVIALLMLFSQMVAEEPLIHPLLSVFLFMTIILWIGFRPRKPHVIHFYMNGMFRKVFLLMVITIGIAMVWIYVYSITVLTVYEIPRPVFLIVLLLTAPIAGIVLVHTLYWSLPFSRKVKGVAAVDAAIARYKRPGESVAGAWEPDLVVDGQAYSIVSYHNHKKETGMLGLDLQGKVVRDPQLIDKIGACSRLAQHVANPELINARTDGYTNTQKMLKLLDQGLARYDRSVRVLGKEGAKAGEDLKQALILFREYSMALCEMWYLEAEWGQQRGNAHLKEVRYEELLELSGRMRAYPLMAEKLEVMLAGMEAAQTILKRIQKDAAIHHQSPDLKPLAELILGFRESAETALEFKAKGKVLTRYTGLSEQDRENWEERLKWVDKVEQGKA